jgi:tryptophan-rich sensory protein
MPATTRPHAKLALAAWLLLTFLVAGVSTLFTTPAIPTWYPTLHKPSFNPPNALFGPVWTILYALMAVSVWLIWKQPSSRARTLGIQLFLLQLALNFAWSFLFFGHHQVGAALIEIVILGLAILATILAFLLVSRPAAALLAPYLLWVAFATVLNLRIWQLN